MGFKMTVEIDPGRSPDAAGEAMRDAFFKDVTYKDRYGRRPSWGENYRLVGCYEEFDWADDCIPLPNEIRDEEEWHRADKRFEFGTVRCAWFWDGDGTLEFTFPDGTRLVNTDCKKSHGWEVE